MFIESKLPASKLCEDYEKFPQLLVNVRVNDKDTPLRDPDVMAVVAEVEETLGDEGRILFRKSGTEPLIRVMVEARGEGICESMAHKVVDAIKAKGYALN